MHLGSEAMKMIGEGIAKDITDAFWFGHGTDEADSTDEDKEETSQADFISATPLPHTPLGSSMKLSASALATASSPVARPTQ